MKVKFSLFLAILSIFLIACQAGMDNRTVYETHDSDHQDNKVESYESEDHDDEKDEDHEGHDHDEKGEDHDDEKDEDYQIEKNKSYENSYYNYETEETFEDELKTISVIDDPSNVSWPRSVTINENQSWYKPTVIADNCGCVITVCNADALNPGATVAS